MSAADWQKIYHGLNTNPGRFRIAGPGMAWKSEEANDVVNCQATDIKWAQWLRVARNFQLRVGLKDRSRQQFDGFTREDHDKIAGLLKQHFGVTLETKDVTFKGWNWGVTDFQGQDLAFLVTNKTSFELSLAAVGNSNIAGRTEVSLDFPPRKKQSRNGPDELAEIRFYVPGSHTRERGSDDGSQKSDDEDEEISAAQAFHDAVKEKAEIGQVAGDMIVRFDEVLVVTPRGRYDVDMFPEHLRLRGKTYDYKVLYSSISRLFLLPKDEIHILFILALDTPIRQGQTRYSYLVTQFLRDEETTLTLNMDDEEIEKHDKLKKEYDAEPAYEVIPAIFRSLTKKKIIGAGTFQSRHAQSAVKASLKAVQGDLFFLDKYVFFVSKQPTLIEMSDIHQAVFSRVSMGSTARTFDLRIVTKSGPEYTFMSISKEEHEVTAAYLKDRNVRVKNEMVPDADMLLAAAGVDESDEEMQSVASSGDEAPKPRLGGGDDDSEEDEDFEASGSDSGSPSDTDSDDSGAATASDASGDREFTAPKKKKVKGKGKAADGETPKKKKKVKAKKGSDDEVMDVDEDELEKPKAKPKPKPKPKTKTSASDDEPAKKKQKVSD